ncbi:PocR ligand-binding domain-containing protein [Desulfobulbus sp. AH-315-M07]|nr:PocR ligand-binding domain-containing protein [Desulfobulbus sp. AH-315-M07]
MSASPDKDLDEAALDEPAERVTSDIVPSKAATTLPLEVGLLDELIDVEALRRLASSCSQLFAVAVRVFADNGTLLADEGGRAAICDMVNETGPGRRACSAVVSTVKKTAATSEEMCSVPCFTGAHYDVVPLEHQGRRVGRLVIGPYRSDAAPPSRRGQRSRELPEALVEVDERLASADSVTAGTVTASTVAAATASEGDRPRALKLLKEMTTMSDAHAVSLHDHVRLVIEAIMMSGYRALVTSKMHVAATRESYRELEGKNAELRDAYQRLQEIDGLKSTFLSTMSHELRTPLTAIIGYGDMLRDGMAGELNDTQRDYLGIIRMQSNTLLKMIVSLLDMSSLEHGTMPVTKGRVDLAELLKEVVQTITPQAVDKGVFVEIGEGPCPPVLGDVERLRQVFLNLVENALKFSSPGGLIAVDARAAEVNMDEEDVGYILFAPLRQRVEIQVVDSGPGIPDDEKTRVFEAFYQVDQSTTRSHAGTGLGLSIVKHLVEAHGGTVHVEDRAPKGAIFVVRLPVWQSASE